MEQTQLKNWPYPLWVAHRGGGKLAPENTLIAFGVGHNHGFSMAEFDVKLSADGHPFLLHDDDLLRTTTLSGIASHRKLSELENIDASHGYSAFAGEKIPSLATIAKFCLANDIAVNIEVKPSKGQDIATAKVVGEVAKTLWKDTKLPPLFSSFSMASLAELQKQYPESKRGLLIGSWDAGDEAILKQLQTLGCVSLHAPDNGVTQERIRFFHEHGYAVLVWTVDDMQRADQLITWGVDGVITDNMKKS